MGIVSVWGGEWETQRRDEGTIPEVKKCVLESEGVVGSRWLTQQYQG